MFTKQHYEAIAQEVNTFIHIPEPIQPIDVVTMLAFLFKRDSTRFDEQKFVKACGMTWEEYCQD